MDVRDGVACIVFQVCARGGELMYQHWHVVTPAEMYRYWVHCDVMDMDRSFIHSYIVATKMYRNVECNVVKVIQG